MYHHPRELIYGNNNNERKNNERDFQIEKKNWVPIEWVDPCDFLFFSTRLLTFKERGASVNAFFVLFGEKDGRGGCVLFVFPLSQKTGRENEKS